MIFLVAIAWRLLLAITTCAVSQLPECFTFSSRVYRTLSPKRTPFTAEIATQVFHSSTVSKSRQQESDRSLFRPQLWDSLLHSGVHFSGGIVSSSVRLSVSQTRHRLPGHRSERQHRSPRAPRERQAFSGARSARWLASVREIDAVRRVFPRVSACEPGRIENPSEVHSSRDEVAATEGLGGGG